MFKIRYNIHLAYLTYTDALDLIRSKYIILVKAKSHLKTKPSPVVSEATF